MIFQKWLEIHLHFNCINCMMIFYLIYKESHFNRIVKIKHTCWNKCGKSFSSLAFFIFKFQKVKMKYELHLLKCEWSCLWWPLNFHVLLLLLLLLLLLFKWLKNKFKFYFSSYKKGYSYHVDTNKKWEHGCSCQFGCSSSNITYILKYKNVILKIFS